MDNQYCQSCEIIFELGMVLHSKAVLHYMVAYQSIQEDVVSNLTAAGQNLRIAAGIMRYIATVLLPKWLSPTGKGGRPAELNEETCLAYEQLFIASAQQMAVVKAITKVGGTPPAVLIKVALAVVNTITGNYDPLRLLPEVKIHYCVVREAYLGFIYKCQAVLYSSKQEVGIAIAYCNKALVRFHSVSMYSHLYDSHLTLYVV